MFNNNICCHFTYFDVQQFYSFWKNTTTAGYKKIFILKFYILFIRSSI